MYDINPLLIVMMVFLALLIVWVGSLLPKKIGASFEIVSVIGVIVLLLYLLPFPEAAILYTAGAVAYGNISIMYNRDKRGQHLGIQNKLDSADSQVIAQNKNMMRLIVDISLTIGVSAGAIIFYMFAPVEYGLIKLIIIIGLITVGLKTVDRIGTFMTTKMYYLEGEERMIILSSFHSRDFPLTDLKQVNHQSAPDLLRLHPLFTFLSENRDFTLSYNEVLRLSFPGEDIYISPDDHKQWQVRFQQFINDSEVIEETEEILPFWHPDNIKRLIWKGYFAATVKGVSAYTGLLIILIFFDVPSYFIVAFVLLWWLFNLYISDRVLIASTDAVEVNEGELFERAKNIFKRAGIEQTKLYFIDSPVHNGLATGMNIGRGTIMITKATTELSVEAVEAIVAHEAVHVKKRDVLTNQVARMLFLGVIAVLVYVFFDQIVLLAENLFLFIPLFYILMILFPLYLSFIAQRTEVRADYLGAQLLPGGHEQMENGLRELGRGVDEAMEKTRQYQMNEEKPINTAQSDERPKWLFRALEFQIMPHPPLYFRINNVGSSQSWSNARNNWMKMRLMESLPLGKKRTKD